MSGFGAAPWMPALQLALRAGVAAGLAVALAVALRLEFPIYAMIAAVIVTDLSPLQTRQLGLQRLAGTVLGAGLGAVVSTLGLAGPIAIGASISVALFACHLLRLPGAARLAAYVCGIVLLEFSAQPWTYAGYRLVETVLGVLAAMAVSAVPLLIPVADKGSPSQ